MIHLIAAFFLAAGAPIHGSSAQSLPIDWQRAEENYAAILDGRKQLHELTYEEKIELVKFRRQWSVRNDTRTPYRRCVDEQRDRLGTAEPSYLDRRVIDMVCRGEKDE